MRYTICRIPRAVDDAIRERSRATGKSFNETVVDVLTDGIGGKGVARRRRDLSDVAGTWKAKRAFAAALAKQNRADEGLWP
jgi:hypothetical protein